MPIRFSTSVRASALRALLAAAIACGAFAASAGEHEDVERLMQSGKLGEALARADKFLQDKPRDPQMRFLKGVIQLDSGKRSEAIATFTQLTQDSPELPEPYNNLAVIYAGQGQYDKARTVLESAIRTNPSYATAYENLGDVYARLASQAYDKALQIDQAGTGAQPKLAVIRNVFSAAAPAKPAPAAVVAATPAPRAAAPAASTPPATAPSAAPSNAKAVAAAPAPSPVAAAAPASGARAEVEAAVLAWAAAWTAQDMERYLAAYGPDFAPAGGQSRKAWEEERRARIVGKSSISVGIDQLAISVDGNTAAARFRQSYRADHLNVNSRKTLELVRSNGQWQIRKETVGG